MPAENLVVLVTGGGRGLGRAIAEYFHQNGYHVVITDYSAGLLNDLEGRDGFLVRAMDVTNRESIASVVADIQQTLGRLDVVINNAGVIDYGPVAERDPEDTVKLFQVNTFGSLRVVHACLSLLSEYQGRVVCVTSESYRLRTPFQAYQVSKLALEGLADTLRRELAHLKVHVATVRPGAIQTQLFSAMNMIDSPVPGGKLSQPFQNFVSNLQKNQPKSVSAPEDVAQVVFRAATDPKRKPHYEINNMKALKLATILPKRVVDGFIKKLLG